jgi:threonine 3-dehydrogenase
MRTMRALVKVNAGPGLSMIEVPRPEPKDNEVLIRVLRTGICGTDLHIQGWDPWAARTIEPPLILGHEFVGEVATIGAKVTDIRVGDVVSGEGHLVCGRCRNCLAGRRHLCMRTRGLGVQVDGAFADYVVLNESNVWVHRGPIDLDVAAIFDPFGNAVHTALTFPVVGEDVVITGAGPIGIMAAAVARHAGAHNVVITDVSDYRLDLARGMGVTAAVNVATTSLADIRRDLNITEGFAVGMEMSGNPDALAEMISNMMNGGRIAILGLPSLAARLDLTEVVFRALTIRGIYGRQMYDTWYAMSVILNSPVPIGQVITDRFGCDDYERAFAVARSARCGKVLLDWTRPGVPIEEVTGVRPHA